MGSAEVGSTPTFQWSRVSGATSYVVEIDDQENFSSPLTTASTANTRFVPVQHLPAAAIYWRVRANGENGSTSSWATAGTVVSRTLAPVPEPLASSQADPLRQPEEHPVLTWSAVAGATQYDVQVDREDDFIDAMTFSSPGTTFDLPQPPESGQWFWRVRAQRGPGLHTDWSAASTYWVSELDPVDGMTAVDLTPEEAPGGPVQDVVLDWEPVPGAVRYELQVGLDRDFTQPVEVKTVLGTRYSPTQTYKNDQFFWRVRGIDAANHKMSWAPEQEFQRSWPQRPSLLHPADGVSTTVGDPLYLQWTPVKHASRYQVDLGYDPSFSPGTFTSCFPHLTTFAPGHYNGCTPGTSPVPGQGSVVHWRVRALDAPRGVEGIYSASRRFVYDSGRVPQTEPAEGGWVSVPTMAWRAAQDAEKYYVEVRNGAGSVVASTTTYALSWTPSNLLPVSSSGSSTFTWTVQSVDANGARSPLPLEGRSFVLTTETADHGAAPLVPVRGTGEPATTRAPLLAWQPLSGAASYRVWVRVAGTSFWFASQSAPLLSSLHRYPAASDTGPYFLNPGSYEWRVQALDSTGGTMGYTPLEEYGTFEVVDLAPVAGHAVALDGNALTHRQSCRVQLGAEITEDRICSNLPITPVLMWDPVPGASEYHVYISNDRALTNRVYEIPERTTNTVFVPPRALADNEAGQSYFWYVRPCKAQNACSADPIGSDRVAMHAFRKASPAVQLQSHSRCAAQATVDVDCVTFSWEDYLATNARHQYDPPDLPPTPEAPAGVVVPPGDAPSSQAARGYRIEVSRNAAFTDLVDTAEVDQPTYTPHDRTYPEGPLWWRVQAVDGSDNRLRWSEARQFRKYSGKVTQLLPTQQQTVSGATLFTWEPKPYAGSYRIQVARNADDTFSQANLVISETTKNPAFVWDRYLPPSPDPYVWRVQWTDVGGQTGDWSDSPTTPGGPRDLRYFRVSQTVLPLTGPAPATYQPAKELYFAWEAADRASRYELQVRQAGGGSVLNVTTPALAHAPASGISNGSYQWRVSAKDANGGDLAVSEWRDFLVDAQGPRVIKQAPLGTAKPRSVFSVSFDEKVVGVGTRTMRLYVKGRRQPLAAKVTLSATRTRVVLKPAARLVRGRSYTVKLTPGIRDAAGNRLTATSWTVGVG